MRARACLSMIAAVCLAEVALNAQSDQRGSSGYLTPPQAVVDILDAEPLPTVTVSPGRDVLAIVARRSMPSIAELAQPMLRLAGLRINPATNGPHRAPSGNGIRLRMVATEAERPVQVPPNARIGTVGFSPDGKRLYFTNTRDSSVDLWVADVATGRARMVDAPLNAIAGGCDWLQDSSALLCTFVPSSRGMAPAAPNLPSGP